VIRGSVVRVGMTGYGIGLSCIGFIGIWVYEFVLGFKSDG
jgi:hypothetical protein